MLDYVYKNNWSFFSTFVRFWVKKEQTFDDAIFDNQNNSLGIVTIIN